MAEVRTVKRSMDKKVRGGRGVRGGSDEKQGRLVVEKGGQGKKICFVVTHGLGNEEVRVELRKEIRQEMAEWKKEIEGRIADIECRLILIEKYIEENKRNVRGIQREEGDYSEREK